VRWEQNDGFRKAAAEQVSHPAHNMLGKQAGGIAQGFGMTLLLAKQQRGRSLIPRINMLGKQAGGIAQGFGMTPVIVGDPLVVRL